MGRSDCGVYPNHTAGNYHCSPDYRLFTLNRIINSRIGRALIAIREDETAAESMGINTTYYKILCFGVGAFFGGLGGGLFAHYMRYLHPSSFGFMRSIEHLCMVVLGGLGNMWGALIGAAALTVIPELLRPIHDFRLLIYGAVLVIMMRVRPQGIIGQRLSAEQAGIGERLFNRWRLAAGHKTKGHI